MKLLRAFWRLFKRQPIRVEPKSERESPGDEEALRQSYMHKKPSYASAQVIRPKRGKAHIQVGLDFGTSATKIVYSQLGRRLSRPIMFKHNLPHYPDYCLPSLAAIDEEGKLLLGIEAAKAISNQEWDSGLQRFKVIVAGNYDEVFKDPVTEKRFCDYRQRKNCGASLTAERLSAVFLAYSIHLSRKVIEKLPEYNDVELDMAFNIGMPIDHIENNKVLQEFKKIFAWAEAIEQTWRVAGKSFDLLAASYELENIPENEETRVFAVPEAVAGVASYCVSLRKQEGLHAIIDLGAGTTDLSIFNLLMPFGESNSYWYAARNIPKGTVNIERRIANYINRINNSPCTPCHVHDCLTSMINNEELRSTALTELRDLHASGEYCRTWGLASKHLAKETEWEKVQVFLCGGGANLPYVERVFSTPWKWSNLQTRQVKYPVSKLPTPDDYDAEEIDAPFERLAIAYGLARPIPELEHYVLPSQSPDHTPPRLPVKEIDHEILYPKP